MAVQREIVDKDGNRLAVVQGGAAKSAVYGKTAAGEWVPLQVDAYGRAILNVGDGSLPAKTVMRTLINAQTVAPGASIGPIDMGVTNEHEIWLFVNIDQQPWTLKASTPHLLTAGAPETLYPIYAANPTTYPATPATALYLGIWALNLAGIAAPSTLVDAKRIAVPPQPGAKVWVFNESANVATVTVKALSVWR